jgi:tetratricopeptide (TPR) repeat protein
MMHERLRKSARWVYLGLALVFAVSFVVAGVGTGGPALSDLIQDQQNDENNTVATSSDSLKDAQAAVDASPDDPKAWLALADAQRGEGDLVKASASADKAISLAKDDPDVNRAAAEIYSARAADNQTKANQIFTRYQELGSTSLPAYVYPGAADVQDPLSLAAQNASQQQLDALLEQAQPFQDAAAAASKQAADALNVVTTAHPDDAGDWFNLAVAASAANDTATAIKAFDMFLELAPGDPLADQVRTELLRLDPSRASTAAGTGTDAGATGTDTAATDTAAAGTDSAATGTDTGTTSTEPATSTAP